MNVLLLNKFHYAKGGAERYYLDISRLLREAGHHVGHLSMAHPRNVPATEADAFVREIDYHGSMGPLGKLKAASRVLYNRESAKKIRELVRARKPHVAHHQNIYHQISLSVVRELARWDIPMVMTLHDYKPVCPGYLLMTEGEICERCRNGRFYHAAIHNCILNSKSASILGSLEAYLHTLWGTYNQIALYLCPSKFLVEKVGEMSNRRINLRHLPNFLPTDEFNPVYKSEPVVVYAGRLSREKGLPTLVEAARRQNVGQGWILRILGEGPLRESLEAQVIEWGLEDAIRFEGFCSGDDLKDAIRNARVVVVPSEWYENQPYAILEAFALGKPVIGSMIGGIPELVLADRTGWPFPPGDIETLGESIRDALDHPDKASEMGRLARCLVEEEHNPTLHMERLLSIYNEVSS